MAQPDLRSAMGNSPSADLGGGSTHSSRDVRTANPEKEVKRSLASRAPTHNEYTELPASLKPHNGAQLRGQEVRPSSANPGDILHVRSPFHNGARTWAQKFEIRHKCRVRGPTRIPTPFQSTKKSKCQPARVLPASREERGSPRIRCSTDPVRHQTHLCLLYTSPSPRD